MLKLLDSGFRLSACDAQAGRNDEKWYFSTRCSMVEKYCIQKGELSGEIPSGTPSGKDVHIARFIEMFSNEVENVTNLAWL